MSQETEKRLSFPELLRRLSVLILPMWPRAVLVAVLLLATLGLELVQPVIIGLAVDAVQADMSGAGAARAAMRTVAFYGVFLLVVAAVRCGVMFVTGVQQAALTQNVLWSLRRQLYQAMQRMSFSFFDSAQSGQLISRSTTDVQRIARFFNGAFFASVEALTVLGVITVYMFVMSPLLAVVALSTVPFTLFVVVRAAVKVREYFREARDSYGDMTTALQENIAGIQVVRAFAREREEIGRFEGKAGTYIRKVVRAVDQWAMRVPVAMLVYQVNTPLILLVGGYLAVKGPAEGGIALGTLVTFFMFTGRMSWRIEMIGRIVNVTARAGAAGDRIYEILDKTPEVREKAEAVELPEGLGEVEFEGVSFGYDPDKGVLHEIDLRVKAGRMVALVGHTGSGKTSLVNLIPRFYDPQEGAVRVDGVDVRDLKLTSLRRNVALIFQETFLFSASIADNIAYGRPDATREEVERCAKAAQAHEFIGQLDEGYDTIIGERGVTLSGGQRQRISIARALLSNPRVLIMDDATASVDSATERQIRQAMGELTRGRTTFVIAHRLSTVRRADLIVVLQGGRIAEMGTHGELLENDGIYKNIYDVQLADVTEEAA